MADPTVTTEIAGAADAPVLSLLAITAFMEQHGARLPDHDIKRYCAKYTSPEFFSTMLGTPRTRVRIMRAATGGPIGYSVLSPPALAIEEEAGDLEIIRLFVLDRYRGQGLGHLFVRDALADAATLGASRLLTGVEVGNSAASSFFARLGFTPIADRTFSEGEALYIERVLARAMSPA